jgi:hypothetical protein
MAAKSVPARSLQRNARMCSSGMRTLWQSTIAYLDKPLIPLAVALPRMLEKIETELADGTAGEAEKWRLRRRAELMRELLTPNSTIPLST